MDARLTAIGELVPRGARLADVGTDHAYLPIALVKKNWIDFAIASDIAEGPLANAKNDIIKSGLQNQIQTRLGSGISPLRFEDHIDCIIVAGMGGRLITNILDSAKLLSKVPTLILQPNIGEPIVRKWLNTHHYAITAEKILAEKGHIYEIIRADHVAEVQPLTSRELLFGPQLLKHQNTVFKQKWQHQLAYRTKLYADLNRASHKDQAHIQQTRQEITFIQEILKNDES